MSLSEAQPADIDNRRLAVARRVFEAQKCFRVFNINGRCWANRATEQAMKQAEAAFAAKDYDRAAHLAAVVLSMLRRDTANFQANPKSWIAKMREAIGNCIDTSGD